MILNIILFCVQARAAKEAALQNILKGSPTLVGGGTTSTQKQRPSRIGGIVDLNLPSSIAHQRFPVTTAQTFPSSSSFSSLHHPPPPMTSRSPTQQNRRPQPPLDSAVIGSTPAAVVQMSSPLDLSSTPVTKRLKLESPSPSRSLGSPNSSSGGGGGGGGGGGVVGNSLQRSSGSDSQPPRSHSSCKSSGGGGQQLQANRIKCHAQSDAVNVWNVNQVCDFVGTIDICAEYVEVSAVHIFYRHFFYSYIYK